MPIDEVYYSVVFHFSLIDPDGFTLQELIEYYLTS